MQGTVFILQSIPTILETGPCVKYCYLYLLQIPFVSSCIKGSGCRIILATLGERV